MLESEKPLPPEAAKFQTPESSWTEKKEALLEQATRPIERAAQIQTRMLQAFRENPDITAGDLQKEFQRLGGPTDLTPEQQSVAKYAMEACIARRQRMLELRHKYPDDYALFTAIAPKCPRPKHALKATLTPFYIRFSIGDPREAVATMKTAGNHKRRDTWTPALYFIGGFITLPRYNPPGSEPKEGRLPLEVPLFLENTTALRWRGKLEEIRAHEEQHVINALFGQYPDYPSPQETQAKSTRLSRERKINQRLSTSETNHAGQLLLDQYLDVLNEDCLERIKDELLAFARQGTDMKSAHRRFSRHGVYRHLRPDYRVGPGSRLGIDNSALIDRYYRASARTAENRFDQQIDRALAAIRELDRLGFNREFSVNMLRHELVINWPKLVNRIQLRAPSEHSKDTPT